ncbi:pathogenicity island protein [Staphylococcus xylosus]|uniref:pathogenicity island protein n=1 Tax=Staphylococcus xylosus TaxID=1288 RepID=UPI002DBF2B2E|nr:pathogenicity island protein [Staphylococcus xylosus]MEB6230017.1 pathogenicity island protein [Staphylococcus xylosus]
MSGGIILQENISESYQQTKISEYELLTKYNPQYINSKIKMAQSHIDEMYHLSTSITTCDSIMGIVSVSYPVDKLVIWISETKDNLNKFKDDSIKRLSILKQVLGDYTQGEQKQVARYLRSNGRIKPYNTIERLQVDLFNLKYGIPTFKRNEDKKVMVM